MQRPRQSPIFLFNEMSSKSKIDIPDIFREWAEGKFRDSKAEDGQRLNRRGGVKLNKKGFYRLRNGNENMVAVDELSATIKEELAATQIRA